MSYAKFTTAFVLKFNNGSRKRVCVLDLNISDAGCEKTLLLLNKHLDYIFDTKNPQEKTCSFLEGGIVNDLSSVYEYNCHDIDDVIETANSLVKLILERNTEKLYEFQAIFCHLFDDIPDNKVNKRFKDFFYNTEQNFDLKFGINSKVDKRIQTKHSGSGRSLKILGPVVLEPYVDDSWRVRKIVVMNIVISEIRVVSEN